MRCFYCKKQRKKSRVLLKIVFYCFT